MITLKALQDTLNYIKKKNNRTNIWMNYSEYYELKEKYIHYNMEEESRLEIFDIFKTIHPGSGIENGEIYSFDIYGSWGEYIYILTDEERIIQDIVE